MGTCFYLLKAEIYATDISQEQIEQAIRLSEKASMPITYAVRPAENSGFDENTFDTITACQCIMYFDKESFIQEIQKIIKNGGLFLKTYMSFLKDDPIASQTKALISQFNPDWNASTPTKSTFFENWFDNPVEECFQVDIPFTRESWHGRTLTMRGVQAQMDETTLQAFSKAHMQMLEKSFPETFTIRHKIFISAYKIWK